jgi:hypothetical protein
LRPVKSSGSFPFLNSFLPAVKSMNGGEGRLKKIQLKYFGNRRFRDEGLMSRFCHIDAVPVTDLSARGGLEGARGRGNVGGPEPNAGE